MLNKCNFSSILCWKSLLSSLPFFKLSFEVSLIGHLTKKIELNPYCPQNGLQDWLTTAHLVQIAWNPSLDENLQGGAEGPWSLRTLWVGTDSQNESNRWRIWWILLPGETSSSTSSSSNLPSDAAFKMSCSSSQSPQTQTIKSIICLVWTPFGSHHVLQSSPEKPVHLELQQLQAFPAYNIGLQIHLQHPTTNARRTLLAAGNTSYFGHLSRTKL